MPAPHGTTEDRSALGLTNHGFRPLHRPAVGRRLGPDRCGDDDGAVDAILAKYWLRPPVPSLLGSLLALFSREDELRAQAQTATLPDDPARDEGRADQGQRAGSARVRRFADRARFRGDPVA